MKIHYMSDIHIDFYCRGSSSVKINKQIDEFLKLSRIIDIPPDERNVFIIPGDISNNNTVAKLFLIKLKELFQHVLIVPGNHDRYLTSKSQAKKYNYDSQNRINDMKLFCKDNNIYYLDGDIVEINGKKFAGVGMSWDKSYYNFLENRLAPDNEVLNFFDNYMNDSRFIMSGFEPYEIPIAYGSKCFRTSFNALEFFNSEYGKLQNFNDYDDIDVVITHYTPIVPPTLNLKHAQDRGTTFYLFDGHKDVDRISPKVWLFGHMHNKFDFNYKDTKFLCNPIGYPQETLYVVDWFEL